MSPLVPAPAGWSHGAAGLAVRTVPLSNRWLIRLAPFGHPLPVELSGGADLYHA